MVKGRPAFGGNLFTLSTGTGYIHLAFAIIMIQEPTPVKDVKVNISHQLLGALIKSMNTTAVDMKPQELSNCLLAALQLKLSAESKITVSFAEAGGR